MELPDEALRTFRVGPDDEGFHPYDPTERWWNESWFWDWYDHDGSTAGHCRIGCIPNQNRVWLWLYLFRGGEWCAVEQPFLDFGLLRRPQIAFDQVGLAFSFDIVDPLRSGRLRVRSSARVISGPRAGRVLPVEVDLAIAAAGVPHSTGQGNEPGHMSEAYDARRMEQPTTLTGTISIGGDERAFDGRGERDHSWGPRYWLLEWSFVALNSEDLKLQCVEVRFPGDGTVEVGYLQTGESTRELDAVGLVVERGEGLRSRLRGTCEVSASDRTSFGFSFEEITSHEMDLSHVLEPFPPKSLYRRALIRATPDHGGTALLGWLEEHLMPEGVNR